MSNLDPKKAVSIVIKATQEKETDAAIARLLISAGACPKNAAKILSSVRDGFRAGVQSSIIGDRVSHDPDTDPYYLAGFAEGKFGMRFTSPGWVLVRILLPFVIAAAVVGYLLWRFGLSR